MKQRVGIIITIYAIFLLLLMLQHPLFMLYYHAKFSTVGIHDWFNVILHGLPLDLSIAGYMTAIPALFCVVSTWLPGKWLKRAFRIYFGIAAMLLSIIFIVDMGLFEYWGFRLDVTPLFYFMTGPKDALASMTGTMMICGILAILAYAFIIYISFLWIYNIKLIRPKSRTFTGIICLLLTASLFIPIRGGLTVSTMNTGKVYFSENQLLNQAALNPAFNLMESASKNKYFGNQYRFMAEAEADRIFSGMIRTTQYEHADSTSLFSVSRPDVIMIILESFSNYLMQETGGDGKVACNLDSLAREGILFTNFYADSFRTDRGLVSILSGYPSQPTNSIMKYPRKTQNLPSIPRSLRDAGYSAEYFYGGDADFTNMRSYLVSCGFQNIVSDADFPLSEKISKWGAPDHHLFNKVREALKNQDQGPALRVIQTSSSHEPFEVPYRRLKDDRLNAFAYTDSCVGAFIRDLKKTPRWEKTLVILIPDHLGAYPADIDNNMESRYRIPLILTGGVVRGPLRIETYASQHDLAATLLAQFGLPHGQFTFSKDIFDPAAPAFAYFSMPDAMGVATAGGMIMHDNRSDKVVTMRGDTAGLTIRSKAYLQKLYDDIASR